MNNKLYIRNFIKSASNGDILNARKNIINALTNKAISRIKLEKRKIAKQIFK